MRLITAAALIGLLTACNAGATTPSEQPLLTPPPSSEVMASPSAAAMSCEAAFDSVDLSSVQSASDLSSVSDQVDTTIGSCASVTDWTTALLKAAPKVPIDDAIHFLEQQCTDNAQLAGSSLCLQVGTGS